MKATIKGELFNKYMKAIKAVTAETNLDFDDMGMHTVAMHTSNVMMLVLDVPKEMFTHYLVEGKEHIGINTNILGKAAATLKKEIELETGHAHLVLKEGTKTYEIAMMDIGDSKKTPPLTYPGSLEVNSDDLLAAFKSLEALNEESNAILEVVGDKLFISNYDNVHKFITTIEGKLTGKMDGKAKFALEFLKMMGIPKDTQIKLELQSDYPLRVSFGEFKYICAPRVEND